LNYIRFNQDESVVVQPVACAEKTRIDLHRHLMLFYVGQERSASAVLLEQSRNMKDREMFERVAQMVELASDLRYALERGQISTVGEILHHGWILKSGLATGISNPVVERYYRLARDAGASGGKLLGAGGGGFFLLFCPSEKHAAVREALGGLREMTFALSRQGSTVIYDDRLNASFLAPAQTLLPQA
jgi:D-glycero-alpha-D-manno-heptose-7-phosphate kinase